MSEPQVTITLGHSGQKVVKRRWSNPNNSQTQSRSKRSLQDDSFLFRSKRARRNDNVKSFASNVAGSRIGQNDLRLKLMRKRMSESGQSTEIHGSVTRGVQSVEKSEGRSVRSITSSSGERQGTDSLTRAFSSITPDGLRLKSTDAIANASLPVADVKYTNEMGKVPSSRLTNVSRNALMVSSDKDEMEHVPSSRLTNVSRSVRMVSSDMNEMGQMPSSRLTNVSRSARVVSSDVTKHSPSTIPVRVPMRPTLDASKQTTLPLLPTSTILRSSPLNAWPLTMDNFLGSLGLEKYAISFQAEEIDMAALKQMGDGDLKELGLPMGPRKKILLAMMPQARRPSARV